MAPIGHRLLHVDEPDNDRRTVEPAPVRLRDPMVQIGHDLAYGFLVCYVGERLGERHDLLAERQRNRQRKRKLFPLQVGLDPPVLIVATIQALDRPAVPGQVVELSALDRLADLTVHAAFIWHALIVPSCCNATVWHAERMEPWSIGLIVLIIAGLAAIIFGALWDRRRNKRRAAEMLAPPARTIPQFHPDAPAPHYLSDLQARRRPEEAESSDLSDTERASITRQLADPRTVTVDAGYASRDFITDSTSDWAVLDEPAVLVCGDAIESFRELISTLEKLILSTTPLVVVAPSIASDVLATLEVNTIRQTMRLLAVICDQKCRGTIATACQAVIIDRSDRQSGYLGPDHLGHCERWISTAASSHLIIAAETAKESA
jgi:hypothetical protein